MFSLILSKTGKVNFQTSGAIFLPVEYSRILRVNLRGVVRGMTGSKLNQLPTEKENTDLALNSQSENNEECVTDSTED